jgi:hypothetical protein
MKLISAVSAVILFLLCAAFVSAQSAQGQPPTVATSNSAGVPPLVNYSGVLTDLEGRPMSGLVGVTFLLYKDSEGGAPLWLETQNVHADKSGHYTATLGSTSNQGIPPEIFVAGQAHWLGVQVSGQAEQPRVLLVTVPFAMKAEDAESLGGKPASAYALATPALNPKSGTADAVVPGVPKKASTAPSADVTGSGATNYIPLWSSATNLADSLIFQSGTKVGVNTTTPGATLSVKGSGTFFANSSTQALEVSQAGGAGSGIIATTNSTNGFGIEGTSTSTTNSGIGGIGVYGFSANPIGIGIEGVNGNIGIDGNNGLAVGPTGVGVQGGGNQYGVYGFTNASVVATTQAGVYGTTDSPLAEAYGVQGIAASTTGSPVGVYGLSSSPNGYGVEGVSGNVGVYGNAGASTSGYGVEGTAANVGVLGNGTGSAGIGVDGHGAGIGLKGVATATSGLAGLFQGGPVKIGGNGNSALLGDPGCGTGYAGIGFLPSGSLSGCTNYALIGDPNGGTYINSHGNGGISFRNKNNKLASFDSSGNLSVVGQTVSTSFVAQGIDFGVYGSSDGASKRGADFGFAGVWGDTAGTPNYAVLGTADKGYAGVFENNGDNLTLYAQNNSSTGALVFWALGSSGDGCTVDTSGNLVCNGNITDAVAVDGGARKVALYAMQSPENWFEDFGSGTLSHGAVRIAIDPAFAQTVNAGTEYHVYLTPDGDSKGLYVSHKTATSFEVREQGGGTSDVAFDYRIVAKRMGYEKVRLADLTEQFDRQEAQRERMQRPAPRSAAPQPSAFTPQSQARATTQGVTAPPN